MNSYANEQGLVAKIGIDIIQAVDNDDTVEVHHLMEQLERFNDTVARRGLTSVANRLKTAYARWQTKKTLITKGVYLDITRQLIKLDLKDY